MKSKNIAESFRYALQGLRHAAERERNFKVHTVCAALAVLCCIAFRVEAFLFLLVIISIIFVLAMELVNTAVEAVTDLLCDRLHPLAKIAKDTAAAAVLLAALQAVVVAAVVAVSVIRQWLG